VEELQTRQDMAADWPSRRSLSGLLWLWDFISVISPSIGTYIQDNIPRYLSTLPNLSGPLDIKLEPAREYLTSWMQSR
jgi:hypothetical protein